MKMKTKAIAKLRSRNSRGLTNDCARREGVDQEDVEGGRGDDRLDHDLARGEPIELLAAVEEDLQRGDGDAQRREAEPVELGRGVLLRLDDEHADADEGERADRHVDIEDPAPGDVVGQPAADHRAEHRPDHDGDAEQRHRRAALLDVVHVEQEALRKRHERRAEQALHQTERDDLAQRLRDAAKDGRDDETGDGGQEHALAAEAIGEEAGRRRHDRRGDDIGGQHPVDLVGARRDAALDIGQRDIGDGRVQRLHDHRKDHAGGDERRGWRLARGRGAFSHAPHRRGRASWLTKSGRPRARPVSTSTVTLMPTRSGGASLGTSIWTRMGMRWTTLTQLPVVFWAGKQREARAGRRADAVDDALPFHGPDRRRR